MDPEEALAAFSRQGEFIDGDLYVYVLDMDGNMLASGGSSAALVGRNVADFKDVTGKPFFRELLDRSREDPSGAVEYRWLNRRDNTVQHKVALFQRIEGRIIAVGYYIPHASREQAAELLERAASAFAEDRDRALEAFMNPSSQYFQDDLYVFAIDLKTTRFIAHGVSPRLMGSDAAALRDTNGRPVFGDAFEQLKKSQSTEIQYTWLNPVTKRAEKKQTFLRRVGHSVIGVGYYTR
jgi:cytochrome c